MCAMGFSPDQAYVLTRLQLIFSVVSLLGASLIVFCYLAYRNLRGLGTKPVHLLIAVALLIRVVCIRSRTLPKTQGILKSCPVRVAFPQTPMVSPRKHVALGFYLVLMVSVSDLLTYSANLLVSIPGKHAHAQSCC